MSLETTNRMFGLKYINEQDFEKARGAMEPTTNIRVFNKAVIDGTMKADPDLRNSIILDYVNMIRLGKYSEQETSEFLFGAAITYSLTEELSNIGYRFPRVSSGVVETFWLERDQNVLHDLLRFYPNYPQDMKTTSGIVIGLDTHSLTSVQIYDENPILKSFFKPMSLYARMGGFSVYNLKREQCISDQLTEWFNR